MRVLFVNARYAPEGVGGPARSLRIWAEAMVREGHEVGVVCRGGGPERRRETREGVEVLRLPPSVPDSEAPGALAEEIERAQPDVLHTNFLKGFDKDGVAGVLGAFPGRKVHTLHEYSLLCREGLLFRDGRMCTGLCNDCRRVAEAARPFSAALDAVVGVSRHVLDRHLAEGLFEGVAERAVIPNSYDPPVAQAAAPRRDPRVLRLGYLGRLSREKGLEHLLETVAGLSPGTPVELLVAGRLDNPYGRQLRRRFDSRRIRFVGYADPARLFAAIDVLVFPSICEETFGRGVIEAQAHGVPVIVSDRGALPELVEPGRTGWIYPPDQPRELSRLILERVGDRASLDAMADACRKAAGAFRTEDVLRMYYRLYEGGAPSAADAV